MLLLITGQVVSKIVLEEYRDMARQHSANGVIFTTTIHNNVMTIHATHLFSNNDFVISNQKFYKTLGAP